MRLLLRTFATSIWFVLAALLILTTETAADELGFVTAVRALVRDGWAAMTDSAYYSLIYAGFWFFSGAVVALWVDYFLRLPRKKSPSNSMIAIFAASEPGLIDLVDDIRLFGSSAIQALDGSYFVNLVFEDLRPEPVAMVSADCDGTWLETGSSERHIEIMFRPRFNHHPFTLLISVRAGEHSTSKYPPQPGEVQHVTISDRQTLVSAIGARSQPQ